MSSMGASTNVAVRSFAVAALLTACGGDPATAPPPGAGGSGAQAGSTSVSGAGGSSAGNGAAGTATTGGTGGSSGSGGSGTSGAPSMTGGKGGGGGTSSSSGGTSGAGDPGSGGSGAGVAGTTSPGGSGGDTSSGGAGAGGTGGAGAGGGAGGSSESLSFEVDIWPMFDVIRDPPFVYYNGSIFEGCTTNGVCHGGENPGADLFMPDVEAAYDALLNVPSVTTLCDGTLRVVPGDAEQSCLILFYRQRLRDELEWVDDTEIDLVHRWIEEGALP